MHQFSGRLAGFAGFALILAMTDVSAADACGVRSGSRIVPLIELYTSEGCSSCPPADRWFSREIRSGEHRANWLSFHVDYWDELGWPDRFASPRHTERQRQRVEAAGQSTVYTPQVMIGPQVQTVWRASAAVERALEAAQGPAQVGLALQLRPQLQGRGLTLLLGAARSGNTTATKAASVWLAQTVDAQETRVGAGENAGVTLHHDRVVTQLWGPWPLGSVPLAKVVDIEPGQSVWGVTAFVQEANGMVLQSLSLAKADCR